jgi:hypothetical protein
MLEIIEDIVPLLRKKGTALVRLLNVLHVPFKSRQNDRSSLNQLKLRRTCVRAQKELLSSERSRDRRYRPHTLKVEYT